MRGGIDFCRTEIKSRSAKSRETRGLSRVSSSAMSILLSLADVHNLFVGLESQRPFQITRETRAVYINLNSYLITISTTRFELNFFFILASGTKISFPPKM